MDYNELDEKERQDVLYQEANAILRKAGYNWNGQPTDEVDPQQTAFEKRVIVVPFRGASRKGKR